MKNLELNLEKIGFNMENKYYIIKDSFAKVENFYQQEGSASWIVEISDWVGNFDNMNKLDYNGNKLIHIGYNPFLNKKEITEDEFNVELGKRMKDLLNIIREKTNSVDDSPTETGFKYNNERQRILQSFLKD